MVLALKKFGFVRLLIHFGDACGGFMAVDEDTTLPYNL